MGASAIVAGEGKSKFGLVDGEGFGSDLRTGMLLVGVNRSFHSDRATEEASSSLQTLYTSISSRSENSRSQVKSYSSGD